MIVINPGRRVNRYRPIYLAELRSAAGGRQKFKLVDFVDIYLPDGQTIRVNIVHRPANLGGLQPLAVCPTCGSDCRVLRVVPWGTGLACSRDVRRREPCFSANKSEDKSKGEMHVYKSI